MLPLRINQVVKAIAAVGLTIGTAVITLATITTLNVTTINATTANSTTASTTALIVGSGTSIDKHLSGTVTIDPASLANLGSFTSATSAVTGASVGDSVFLTRPLAWMASTSSVLMAGYISATNVLTVGFWNSSSTVNDLPSAAPTYDIWSH